MADRRRSPLKNLPNGFQRFRPSFLASKKRSILARSPFKTSQYNRNHVSLYDPCDTLRTNEHPLMPSLHQNIEDAQHSMPTNKVLFQTEGDYCPADTFKVKPRNDIATQFNPQLQRRAYFPTNTFRAGVSSSPAYKRHRNSSRNEQENLDDISIRWCV